MEASGENVGMAAAAAISRDGYLLTAGHVVADAEKLDVVVVIPDENRRVTQAAAVPARIVWMSEDDFGRNWDPDNPKFPLDFAIIHVDVAPLVPFKLADELPRTDEPVIGAGWGMRDVEVLENWGELAAGNVLSVHQQEPRGSSPAWTAVLHDIPLLRGDSGGPVLDREGNLVGISGAVVFRPGVLRVLAMHLGRAPRNFEDFGYSVVAYMPDPDWIREVIEKDRLQRNAGSATSDPQAQGELR